MAIDTEKFSKDLGSGETLLWTGIPRQGMYFQKSDLFVVPFSAACLAFACYWEYSVYQIYLRDKANLIGVLFGIAFVLAGIYMLVLRFFFEASQRKKTFYAVTDQRVLIKDLSGGLETLVSIDRKNLPPLTIQRSKQNLVTIQFGPWLREGGRRHASRPPTFEQIQEGDAVVQLLRLPKD